MNFKLKHSFKYFRTYMKNSLLINKGQLISNEKNIILYLDSKHRDKRKIRVVIKYRIVRLS